MGITTTSPTGGGSDFFNSLDRQKILAELAVQVEFFIRNRTADGKDVDGNTFTRYNEEYAKKKRRIKRVKTYPPNLVWDEDSGMMQKITHEVFNDNKSAEVFINSPQKEQLAIYHNIMGAGKGKVIRKFWGLSNDEEEQLMDKFGDDIAELGIDAVANEVLTILKKLESEN